MGCNGAYYTHVCVYGNEVYIHPESQEMLKKFSRDATVVDKNPIFSGRLMLVKKWFELFIGT